MSEWTELEPDRKPAGAPKAPVRFGLMKMRKARSRGRVLILRDVVSQLGMKTWRVNVRLGKGARQHQIAIIPDEQGRFELQELGKSKGGGTFSINMPVVERFPDVPFSPMEVRWTVEAEGKRKILVVDLPPFCWDDGERRRLLQRKGA
ncbi:hypothetical protein [Microbaculum marinum]|uniref:Uncharacterized protein n=1 Tax=Microbaculum marinum TaxID=1764581 RepID=A0AAW9RPE4_9HYPH